MTSLKLLADLNNDWVVDQYDIELLYDNWVLNLQNPTQQDGDLDGDGDIDHLDLDLAFAQLGMGLLVI